MMTKQTKTKVSKLDLVLGLDPRSTDYHVALSADETREFLKRAEIYNNIPENLSDIVDEIDAITPRRYYNQDNPNNGQQAFNFKVGNEGSRVLYLKVSGGLSSVTGLNWDEYEKKVMAIGRKFDADEVQVVEKSVPHYLIVRFWWD